MKLKQPPPPNRSLEQLRNHYLVEKNIAKRLMAADRDERKVIYTTMYEELFDKVPDHPRLTRRISDDVTAASNRIKLALIRRFVNKSTVFLEYAPGDCRFVTDVAKQVKFAYGLDISDQRRVGEQSPNNFELVIYDGYDVDGIRDGSVDVIFSDQLIEHFHPEDTRLHFQLAHRLLRKRGLYVFRTPHILTGPHDVSKYFCDTPECFHLKEWSYRELRSLILGVGYSQFRPYWYRRTTLVRLPIFYFTGLEKLFDQLPKRTIRKIADLTLSQVCGVAVK